MAVTCLEEGMSEGGERERMRERGGEMEEEGPGEAERVLSGQEIRHLVNVMTFILIVLSSLSSVSGS